ncbi:MAG TPA: LamG-like jellyroll fold domain-containing protein, partial [Gemmatimonadaceae bacterium]|nr:LamG-like jellyroll fold domain-containing protein [Gemmatimonadaceae bacterium]
MLTATRGSVTLAAPNVTIESFRWYQAAVTYDGRTLALYVDGQLQASAPTTDALPAMTVPKLRIAGRWVAAGDPGDDEPLQRDFSGEILRISVLDRAATADEISRVRFSVPDPSGGSTSAWTALWQDVVGYYDFATMPAADLSATHLALGNVSGDTGYWLTTTALFLPGNVAIPLGDGPALDVAMARPWTIEAWLAPDRLDWTGTLLSRRSAGAGVALVIDQGFPVVWLGNVAVRAPAQLEDGVWHHVAAVFDGAQLRLVIDGAQVAAAAAAPSVASRVPLMLGVGEAGDFFRGHLQEVRWWGTARSLGDIAAQMHAVPWYDPALVGYWTFELYSETDLTGRFAIGDYDDGLVEEVCRFVTATAAPALAESVRRRAQALLAPPRSVGVGGGDE